MSQDLDFIRDVVDNYSGDSSSLYSAVGAFVCGKYLGWKVLRITLSNGSYLKYQKILGVEFKSLLPENGEFSRKSIGLSLIKDATHFWDVVKGKSSVSMDYVVKRSLRLIES